jgi:signal transduction histidine kinase
VSLRSRDILRRLVGCVALGAVYAVVAKLALALDAVGGFATLVWPPTGIALSAILLGGYGLWPGVAAGAFAANLLTGAPPAVAVGIAVGNTAEALLGAWALGRSSSFGRSLTRLRDVLTLIGVAAVSSTVVSATIGVGSLWLGGLVATARAGETWAAWWVGDMVGDLIIAPLLLALVPSRDEWRDRAPFGVARAIEGFALGLLLLGTTGILFTGPAIAASVRHPYMIFPLLIWAAVSFGIRGAALAVFVVSAVAIAGAAAGGGPFARPHLAASLWQLQAFMAIVAATTLVLGAVSEERRRALAMRESLISLAAHELKTPLTSLLLRIQKLGRSLGEGAPANADPARDAVALERLVKRIGRLVDDLLDVSRMATETILLDLEDVDLVVLTREIVERLPDSQQTLISIDSSSSSAVGRWDRLRVDQVVTNLVSNALKYGNRKPVRLTIDRLDERARLVVCDQGVGIAEQDLKRIFERFERAASRHVSGFGVGLWIVRHLVRSMGGTVAVTSRLGAGSTFVVDLPLRPRT